MNNSCRVCQILPQKLSSYGLLIVSVSWNVPYLVCVSVFHSWAKTLSRFCKCKVIFTCRKPASRARTLEYWVSVISRGNLKDIQKAVGCCQVWVLFLKIRAGHKCFSLRTKFYWVSLRKRKNYKEMERNSVCSSRPVNVWPLFLFSSDHFIVSP